MVVSKFFLICLGFASALASRTSASLQISEFMARYLVPPDDSLGLTWTEAPGIFDDSNWTSASNGVGSESSLGIPEPGGSQGHQLRIGDSLEFSFRKNKLANDVTLHPRGIIGSGYLGHCGRGHFTA